MSVKRKRELKDYQKENANKIALEPTHAALVADMTGTGKSVTAAAVLVHPAVNAKKTLIICPTNTFGSDYKGWRAIIQNWTDLPVYDMNAKTYEACLAQWKDPDSRGVWLIGREWFSIATTDLWHKREDGTEDTTRPPKRPAKWRWSTYNRYLDVVIFDEVHAASNRKSKRFASLKQIKPKRLKIALSATYQGDSFSGAWAPTRWLWPDAVNQDTGLPVVDRSFWRWVNQWAQTEFDPHSQSGKKVVGEKTPGAFVQSLPCYTREESEKVPYHTYRCPLTLGPEQARQYNQMRENAITWLEENPLVADLPIVQKTRLRQMLLGTVDLTDEEEVVFPEDTQSAKIDAVFKILDREPGKKMMIYVDSKKLPPIVAARLRDRGHRAVYWTGEVSKKKRADLIDRFLLPFDDPEAVNFIVASITAISDGTDGLQDVCSTEIWMSRVMSGIKNEQADGRLNRMGQPAEYITRYELYVPGTADDEDYERDAKKALMRSKELSL